MASQASKQDFANFVQAAQQEGFRGAACPEAQIRARLRDWAVESGLLKPGDVAPAEAYAAFMGQFLAANVGLYNVRKRKLSWTRRPREQSSRRIVARPGGFLARTTMKSVPPTRSTSTLIVMPFGITTQLWTRR